MSPLAASYTHALHDFLRDPRAAGWARIPPLVTAARKAAALADEALAAGKPVLPAPQDAFNALRLTPLHRVRVVILGQDPYPTPGHAHGLAFSVRAGVKPLPASLRNIFNELRADLGLDPPAAGDLSQWAEHGVLLLNTALTVEAGKAGAHMKWPWREMTREAIAAVSRERSRVVFLLWGRKAQTYASLIDATRHLIVAAEHPSPLSAYRGFLGSKPFSRVNAWLAAHGEDGIPWGRISGT
ncbi:MAG: uracil-DNA glycosylase [Hyphomicrobiales bacterium]